MLKNTGLAVIVFVLTGIAYLQGVSGDLFYDDLSNLSALEHIDNAEQARHFVLEGTAGPLGRPLALLSFLPHAESWPESSYIAIAVNVAIHLLNGLLLLCLGRLILKRVRFFSEPVNKQIALMAAALWLVMPLLASTSLIVVQRMAGLSVFFGLIGLVLYMRFTGTERPRLELFGGFFLLLFTALGMLAKENAIIFPVLALCIEWLIVRDHDGRFWAKLRSRLLLLYLVILLAALVYAAPPTLTGIEPYRDFSLLDRLASQVVILWQYLWLAFYPSLNAYGPYHDDVRVVVEYSLVYIGLAGFLIVLVIAFLIRKRFPFLLFGLLWFFAAHLIESSVIMLELYFEHRNYLALYALTLALAAMVFHVRERYFKLALSAFWLYVLLQWSVLFLLANIWGKQLDAAENWVQNNPGSSRAVMALSAKYYEELGSPALSLQTLDRGMNYCADCLDMKMQALLYACLVGDSTSISERFEDLVATAPYGNLTPATTDGLYSLREFVVAGSCGNLGLEKIRGLINSLARNIRYETGDSYIHLSYHRAINLADLKHFNEAHEVLDELEKVRDIFAAVVLRAQIYVQQGNADSAIGYLQIKMDSTNIGKVDPDHWKQKLREFKDTVSEDESGR